KQLLSLVREPRDRRFLDVVGGHLHELRLRRISRRRTSGQDQIRQLVVGLEARGLAIEGRARNTGGLCFRPQRRDELRKGGVGGAGGSKGGSEQQHCRNKRGASQTLCKAADSSHFTATMKIRGKRNSTLPSACGR